MFLAVSALGYAAQANAAITNLIANPSLETANGTVPLGWTSLKTGTNTTTFSYPSFGAQNGSRYVKISIASYTSGGAYWYFTPVAITPGTNYSFSNYYLSTAVSTTIAQFQDAAGNITTQTLGTDTASPSWKLAAFTFTAPVTAVKVTIYQQLARVGVLQTDNYSLTLAAGTLVVKKIVYNSGGGTLTASNFSFSVNGGTAVAFNSTGSNSLAELVGTYTVTETAAANYKATYTNCTNVAVTANGTTTCTITNTYTPATGTLVVKKVVVNTGGGTATASNFSFSVNGGTAVAFASTGSNTLTEPAGTYTVTETAAANYTPTYSNCTNIAVTANTTTTCTVTNTYVPPTGTLAVKEVLVNTGGGTAVLTNFSFSVNGGTAVAFNSTGENDLTEPVGTYTVTAPTVANYTTTFANCSGVAVTAGATTTCTVTNTYVPPTTVELVPNPSVELGSATSTVPTNWNTDVWSTGAAGTYAATFTWETTGHTGNRSITASLTSCANYCEARWFFDRQVAIPNRTYTFSDWYKSTVATQVYLQVLTSTGKYNQQLPDAPAETAWTQYTATFTMPADAEQFTILHTIAAVGTLTTDDYSVPGPADPGFTRGLVSINFDDGYQDVYDNALPILDKYGLKSTQFIVSYCVNGAVNGTCTTPDTDEMDLPVMSKANISTMYTDGQEIGSHTMYHHRLNELPADDNLTQELVQSQTDLKADFPGAVVDNFAAPYGVVDANSLALIKTTYKSNRSTDIGYNVHSNLDRYDIKIQYVMPATTLAEFQGWIAQAMQDKSWLVLLYHSVGDVSPENSYDYNVTTANFDAQMNALKTSSAPVLTNEQALQELMPQVNQVWP